MTEIIEDLMDYKKKLLEELDKFTELQNTKAKKVISFSINTIFSELSIMGHITPEYVRIMYIQLKDDIYNTLLTTKLSDEQIKSLTDIIMYNIANIMTISSEGKGMKLKEKTTNINISKLEQDAFR